jgi:hypothetical protein
MDITDILANIKSRFEVMLATLKAEKEKVVTDWLNNMIAFFSEQKLSLCCAIDNVNSAVENQRVREYIEAQRIQAAQAEMQLVIGDRSDATLISLNSSICQYPPKGNSGDPPPLTDLDPVVGEISPAYAIVNIDTAQNYNSLTAVTVPLPPGKYYAELTKCCSSYSCVNIANEPSNYYQGRFQLNYLHQNKSGSSELMTADNGLVHEAQEYTENCFYLLDCATSYWLGTMVAFEHVGTEIQLWVPPPIVEHCSKTGSGWLQIVIREATTMLTPLTNCSTVPPLPTDITGVSNPDNPDVFNCDMSAECVNWYETGWRTGACCGAHLSAGGVDWIVVKRSIADDIICGGGESLNTPCIKEALEFGFHPSVAFPTSNGLEFLGKPTSSQRLFRDINLETEIMSKIRSGSVYSIKGDPAHNFEAILFPYDVVSGS